MFCRETFQGDSRESEMNVCPRNALETSLTRPKDFGYEQICIDPPQPTDVGGNAIFSVSCRCVWREREKKIAGSPRR